MGKKKKPPKKYQPRFVPALKKWMEFLENIKSEAK